MTVGTRLLNIAILCLATIVVAACSTQTYYDDTQVGTGIFSGGKGYRLREPAELSQPYRYARPAVAAAAGSEIRIFTPRSFRGDLGRLTTACARRAGVFGPVQVNTGIVKGEKFASLMPAANVSAYQQERTAQCVEASIKQ